MADCDGQEADLLDRFKARDVQALAQLFSRHRERLWQIIHFRLDERLRGRVDEDDLLQEAYLDAAGRLSHFEDQGGGLSSAFLWLRMIVYQTLRDVHRRHLGTQRRNVGREESIHARHSPQATSISIASGLLGQLTSPSQAAIRAELSDQLQAVLAEMDPTDREVLALRHFEELTNSEVADVLRIEQKAASMRYVRALERLKRILERISGFVEEQSTD